MDINQKLQLKFDHLKNNLREIGEVIIAYSGGVDSAFLIKVAHDVLDEKATAMLAISPSFPTRDFDHAIALADKIGIELKVIRTDEMDNESYTKNPSNRCYFCKSELYNKIAEISGNSEIQVVDGSNQDDLKDFRPGRMALKENNVKSPLQEAGLTKEEIRILSKELDLPTWNKDAMACLSSRFPFGEEITKGKLNKVDQVENIVASYGFNDIRARHLGEHVRIEVRSDQVSRFDDEKFYKLIEQKICSVGYKKVIIDPMGYKQGNLSMKRGNSELNFSNIRVDR